MMIEVCGYKAFYGTIVTNSNQTIGPCNFLFMPDNAVWLSDSGDEYYEFEVMSTMPYVNISSCRGEKGNPDCDTHDNCMYEVVEEHDNVHVEVLRCKRCGNIELSWYRDNPENLDVDISIGGESL